MAGEEWVWNDEEEWVNTGEVEKKYSMLKRHSEREGRGRMKYSIFNVQVLSQRGLA